MNEADLEKLEKRLDDLIHAFGRLKNENRALKTNESQLTEAHSRLRDKMQVARERIEGMIGRLKALERSP